MTVADETAPATFEAHFPPRTHAEWSELAAAVVNKKRPPDRRLDPTAAVAALRTSLPGDLVIDPLYTRPENGPALGAPGVMPFTRGRVVRDARVAWDVRSLHDDPDSSASRAAVVTDLENGATSIWIHVGADGIAAAQVSEVLADVRPDLAPVVVTSWDCQPAAATALLEVVTDKPGAVGNLGLDPIGAAARTGDDVSLAALTALVEAAMGHDRVTAMTADGRVYHDAGASDVDEIAMVVAAAVAYMRHLEHAGIGPARAFGQIEFRLAATADQFLTTAKFRALRRIWARIGELGGVPEALRGARTHAVTSSRMFTRDDPWVNVLRSTLATFGASVGGADSITVLPFDTVHGLPTAFSRRLARNTQTLLAAEANVARVTDPAGGSWYVESLTDDLASTAWWAFQDLERAGGMIQSLQDGVVAHRLGETAATRAGMVSDRSQPITGVSIFPLAEEQPLERVARAPLRVSGKALVPHRDSEVFEALRDRASAYATRTGHRPRVAVPTLEVPRAADRRVEAVNLLAVAGIEAVDEAPVALMPSGGGYEGVTRDADVVSLLNALLDATGAPA